MSGVPITLPKFQYRSIIPGKNGSQNLLFCGLLLFLIKITSIAIRQKIAHICYDFFEWMVEELIDVIQFIFLRVAEIDGQKKVAVTVKGVENLSVLTEKKPELYVEQETEDEWFVSIKV